MTMPKSRKTTVLFDGVVDESLPFSTTYIASLNKQHEAKNLKNTSTFDDDLIVSSTPFPVIEITSRRRSSFFRCLKNPMEQSILKTSEKRKSKNVENSKKKVFFISPEIVEISSIDEKMRKSFLAEQKKSKAALEVCSNQKGTPIRQHSKVKPRLLNFTESASKLDTKKQENNKIESKIPRVKRLVGKKKTSPIQQQQEKAKDTENFLKGVKLNRRFELLMKHMAKTKTNIYLN